MNLYDEPEFTPHERRKLRGMMRLLEAQGYLLDDSFYCETVCGIEETTTTATQEPDQYSAGYCLEPNICCLPNNAEPPPTTTTADPSDS